ncbi:hypothetical protein [Streptomyces sp. NPDC093109]|uniref:hypothetical protein n=1 Tax=Streptomyces sp. NPDC093109 TaxID=3154977 RepID=UPI0034505DB7
MAQENVESRVRLVHGVPVGYPHTEAGAKAAAANYTVVMGSSRFLIDRSFRRRAVSVLGVSSAASAVAREADRRADRVVGELRGENAKADPRQAIARTGVLSARVLGFDIHKAAVRLWITTVRGNAAGHATPRAAFQSVTLILVWEDNDWKMQGSSAAGGLVAPIDTRQASNVTRDFADYVPASAADPVMSGAVGAGGFPAAYVRNEREARAAATSAAMLYGDPRFFTDSGWRHRMLNATAAPSVLGTVTSEADTTARLVVENRALGADGRTVDGGALVTRTAVLATRSVAYSGQAASVELWTASVGGVAGTDETQRPRVAFLRMAVELTWAEGTWKTLAVTPSEPLVPAPPAEEQASSAASFASVGGAGDAPALP